MWIKLISGVAGPKFAYEPGQEVNHPNDDEAKRWVARDIAVDITPREPQTAVLPRPEVAVIRRRRRNQA